MAETARNVLSSFFQFNIISSHFAAFSSFISRQLNSSSRNPVFIRIRFMNSFNQTIAIAIPTLASLIQLKKNDPFTTNPTTMRVAAFTTILFYLTYAAVLRFPLRRRRAAMIADHFLLSIGNASVACLASVLFPESLRALVFALSGLLSTAELLYWMYGKVVNDDDDDIWRMRVSELFNDVRTAFTDFTGHPILPL